MNDNFLTGVWTAIATPFLDNGSIDWQAFESILNHQTAGNVSGVVISGTTGESPTLTVQEKISLVRKARAFLPSSVRIMAGSGGNNTAQSIELSKLCVDAGADSLLIVTPPYNKPSVAGLKIHFQTIAEAVATPLCLYHVPGRTGQSLSAATIAELTTIKNVSAVKEASGDLSLYGRLVCQTKASVLSGDDPTYLASLAVGGSGVISVISNIMPSEMVYLTNAFKDQKQDIALSVHKALLPVIDVLFCESNPGPLKAALSILGFCKNILRPPLAPVSQNNFKLIQTTLEQARRELNILGIK
jgi:4-hydroxy-tetrahydrodipicolinate synthase